MTQHDYKPEKMPADPQAILDYVVPKLWEQGPSQEAGSCVYRSPEGKRCALGLLLPDSAYQDRFDAMYEDAANIRDAVLNKIADYNKWTMNELRDLHEFFLDLQEVHDEAAIAGQAFHAVFRDKIEDLTKSRNLKDPLDSDNHDEGA